jgi:hypothetical protein
MNPRAIIAALHVQVFPGSIPDESRLAPRAWRRGFGIPVKLLDGKVTALKL